MFTEHDLQYLKTWNGLAQRWLDGDLVLWMRTCHAEGPDCSPEDHDWFKLGPDRGVEHPLRAALRALQAGLAPCFWLAQPDVDVPNVDYGTLKDLDQLYWMGDCASQGYVGCGVLLAELLERFPGMTSYSRAAYPWTLISQATDPDQAPEARRLSGEVLGMWNLVSRLWEREGGVPCP